MSISVQRWREIDLEEPGFKALIYENIKAKELEAVVVLHLCVDLTRCVELISVWQVHLDTIP